MKLICLSLHIFILFFHFDRKLFLFPVW